MMSSDTSPGSLFEEFPPVSRKEWEAAIAADLPSADSRRRLVRETLEGIRLRPYYRSDDVEEFHQQPVILRSLLHAPELGCRWQISQPLATPDLGAAIQDALSAFKGGADSLSLICVQGAQAGGSAGIPLQGQLLFDSLLEQLPVREFPLHFRAGAAAMATGGMLLSAAERGIVVASGSLDLDPLRDLARCGGAVERFAQRLRDAAHLARQFHNYGTNWRTLCVDTGYVHRSGGSVVQELAVTLAQAVDFLSALEEEGVGVEESAKSLFFFLEVGPDYFLQIAKFRALRIVWPAVLREFGVSSSIAVKAQIHAGTSSWNQTLADPHLNILRGVTEATSAALGGCDVIEVTPYDHRYGASSETAKRIARNTQIILREEAHLDKVADPAAGSYYVEWLTDAVARESWSLFQKIESRGGFCAAVSSGWLQDEISSVRARREDLLASRREVLVGVNNYPNSNERILPELTGASGAEPPPGISTTSTPDPKFQVFSAFEKPAATPFEKIRLRTERYAQVSGRTPAAFLFTAGNVMSRNARAHFARNLLGCAGLAIYESSHPGNLDMAIEEALKSGAEIVVLCSSDEAYLELAASVCPLFKSRFPSGIVAVAGFSEESVVALRALGVSEFLNRRMDALEVLRSFQRKLGILGEEK